MQVEPSSIQGVELIGPDAARFNEDIEALLGRPVDGILKPALPFSVIVSNQRPRAIALLGVRFDMVGRTRKPFSVIHYADTLRHPEKADLRPGGIRFVCAEPLYTDYVLRRAVDIAGRGPMNLENLRGARRMHVSLDCAALDDGTFAGPDSLGAFERIAAESEAEASFVEEILTAGCPLEALLEKTMEVLAEKTRDRASLARRVLARRLSEGLEAGGVEEVRLRARAHRIRIELHRE